MTTRHAIAGAQGPRAFCRCGKTFTGPNSTGLLELIEHVEAEGFDPGADPWTELAATDA